jgi:predicted DNA binding CopG/RHH family protein
VVRKQLPNFASEAEEAQWYQDHQDELEDYFEPVTAAGNPGLGFEPVGRTQPITIRVSVPDIDRARAIAASKGIGYQTLLKMAIHEWLDEEDRRRA